MATYRIVSFDGGGIRGLFSVALLEELDKRHPGFLEKVDLFAGTSTGGLISLSLAKGMDLPSIRNIFVENGALMFSRPWWRRVPGISFLIDLFLAKYSNQNLKNVMVKIFGEQLRLGDLERNVVISSFEIDNKKADEEPPEKRYWKPKFFHNYEIENDTDIPESVVDVAMRTAAAPTYFPLYGRFVDGGIVVNNPSLAGLLQAIYKPEDHVNDHRENMPEGLHEIALLSIGTGKYDKFIDRRNMRWGILPWAKPFADISISTLTGMAAWQCEALLGERFERLNPYFMQGEEVVYIPVDGVDQMDFMLGVVKERYIQDFLDETASWMEKHFL